jgi:protoporphyrinogen/coproporphyrinogen III oxidase
VNIAIIGAGLSGLSTAYYLKRERPDWQITVFEKEPEVGGKVRSSLKDGFTFDWASNGFLTNVSETLELAQSLGLETQVASDAAKHRFLFKNGGLKRFPDSPPKFLSTDLLSLWGKIRAALEFFIGKSSQQEETVYDFIKRHFGTDVAEVFAEPAILGITAGDAKKLSIDALFPRFRKLEQSKGSLLKALIEAQKQNKGKAPSRLTSFKGGMQTLVSSLESALQTNLRKRAEVTYFSPLAEGGYALMLSSGETLNADAVVLATPAFVSSKLINSFLPETAKRLEGIPYADVSVFGLGYHRFDVPQPLDGFGFLVPRGEKVRSLGVLWSNALFSDQAPKDRVLLRAICGGEMDPEFIKLNQDESLQIVRHDLRVTMGITAEPVFTEQVSWPKGIPQYYLGHSQNVSAIMQSLESYKGLYLTGNAFYGVGVNDCVRDAKRVVSMLTS